tara:strand:+ start:9723 stop:18293 length:8571 start_codon:yes stop_codon:yes gene_type:complete
MAEPARAFKLEITIDDKTIAFGPRSIGQVGRDILAIKVALGIVQSQEDMLQGVDDPNSESNGASGSPTIPLDKQNWFECGTGLGIDILKASTYDNRLHNALINFQIKNQFLIVLYYFQKYGVKELIKVSKEKFGPRPDEGMPDYRARSESGMIKTIESARILFESEFQSLGEATIALLHGWMPYTVVRNDGYNHNNVFRSPDYGSVMVLDLIPEALGLQFEAGDFGQTYQDLVDDERLVLYPPENLPRPIAYSDPADLEWYEKHTPESFKWTGPARAAADDDLTARYASIHWRYVRGGSSRLYRACQKVVQYSFEEAPESLLTPEERAANLERAFYPDPFVNPDPFIINNTQIGFFDETEFLLAPDSDLLPNNDEETIRRLEDIALTKVLDHYGKPEIWNFYKNDRSFNIAYFLDLNSEDFSLSPNHSGHYPIDMSYPGEKLLEYEHPKYTELVALLEKYKKMLKDHLDPDQEEWYGEAPEVLRDADDGNDLLSSGAPYSERWLQVKEKLERVVEALQFQLPYFFGNNRIQLPGIADLFETRRDEVLNRNIRYLEDPDKRSLLEATDEEKKKDFWVLSTDKHVESDRSRDKVETWRTVEDVPGVEPLIKFIEYRTPSLRPGQKYRAFFKINKEKLDLISDGLVFPLVVEEEEPAVEQQTEECADQNSEQSLRTYQEYQIHARKKRRELVRKIRSEVAKQNTPGQTKIDLGTYGPFNMNEAFQPLAGTGPMSDYEYTKKVLSTTVQGAEALWESTFGSTELESLNSLVEESNNKLTSDSPEENKIEISLKELKDRVKSASKDLKKAAEIVRKEQIQFAPGSNFDGENEASKLSQIPDLLRKLAESADSALAAWQDQNINIVLEFKTTRPQSGVAGPKNGKKITKLIFQAFEKKPSEIKFFAKPKLKSINSESLLLRPRTINYLNKIYEMTGGKEWYKRAFNVANQKSVISEYFLDPRGSCKELGINLDQTLARSYVANYTSGLSVIVPDEENLGEAFITWGGKAFVDPVIKYARQTRDNFNEGLKDTYDEKKALSLLGKQLDLDEIYDGFISKLSITSLLCDYIKCMKIPEFEIKAPNLYFPPPPPIPILGWYAGLFKAIKNTWLDAIKRIIMTFVKTIIDKLSFPFCEDQLAEFIAAGSTSSPLFNQAVVDSLINTGIMAKDKEKAKTFFDESVNLLTPQELCHLFSGKEIDPAGMLMLRQRVDSLGLGDDLDSNEAIENFFGVIGSYVPSNICDEYSRFSDLPEVASCEETTDLLRAIRNRLQTGDSTLTEEEIEAVIQQAKDNLESSRASLQALTSEDVSSLAPTMYGIGDKTAAISDFPKFLKDELENTNKTVFSSAKLSYISALNFYIPAMAMTLPDAPKAGDSSYSEHDVLEMESILETLQRYTQLVASENPTTDDGLNREDLEAAIDEAERWLAAFKAGRAVTVTMPDESGNMLTSRIEVRIVCPDSSGEVQFMTYNELTAEMRLLRPGRQEYPDGEVHDNPVLTDETAPIFNSMHTALSTLDAIPEFQQKLARRTDMGRRLRDLAIAPDPGEIFFRRAQVLHTLYEVTERKKGGNPDNWHYVHRFKQVSNNPEDTTLNGGAFANPSGTEYTYDEFIEQSRNVRPDQSFNPRLSVFEDADKRFSLVRFYPPLVTRAISPGRALNEDRMEEEHAEALALFANVSAAGIPAEDKFISDRLNFLSTRLTEILQRRLDAKTSVHLPVVRDIFNRTLERARENINADADPEGLGIRGSNQIYFDFQSDAYKPKMHMTEFLDPDGPPGVDKYKITTQEDFFIGHRQGDANATKTWEYCEKLPEGLVENNSEPDVLPKREGFANMALDAISTVIPNFRALNQSRAVKRGFYGETYKGTFESVMENVLFSLGSSPMFEEQYASDISKRISGKLLRDFNCVTNRYNLGSESILSFEKVILGDTMSEVMKMMSKSENNPVFQDFNSPGPYDQALQAIAIKALVRLCLIDLLLKGGLAYAVWDIEPVLGDRFFLDYAVTHVKVEIVKRNIPWREMIILAMEIEDPNVALDTLVRQEILKLGSYSKQIFHPLRQQEDWYNWYTKQYIPRKQVSSKVSVVGTPNGDQVAIWESELTVLNRGSTTEIIALPDQGINDAYRAAIEKRKAFVLEKYVRIPPEIVNTFSSLADSAIPEIELTEDEVLRTEIGADCKELQRLLHSRWILKNSSRDEFYENFVTDDIYEAFSDRFELKELFDSIECDETYSAWHRGQTVVINCPDLGGLSKGAWLEANGHPTLQELNLNIKQLDHCIDAYLSQRVAELTRRVHAHCHRKGWRIVIRIYRENHNGQAELCMPAFSERFPAVQIPRADRVLPIASTEKVPLHLGAGPEAKWVGTKNGPRTRYIPAPVRAHREALRRAELEEEAGPDRDWQHVQWQTLYEEAIVAQNLERARREQIEQENIEGLEDNRRVDYIATYGQFIAVLRRIRQHLGFPEARRLLTEHKAKQGVRLVHFGFDTNFTKTMLEDERWKAAALNEKTWQMSSPIDEAENIVNDPATSNKILACIPFAKFERVLDFEECYSVGTFHGQNLTDADVYMEQEILKKDETKYIFEHIFPARRFMAISTAFSTSVLSGFNQLPGILDSAKVMTAYAGLIAASPVMTRDRMVSEYQDEFQKRMNENYPSDPESVDCFDFPDLSYEIFVKFLQDLKKLLSEFPSILLRGLANNLDPAYKEMRKHYMNCDIENLTYDGLKLSSGAAKLVNGLYLPRGEQDRKQQKGKYVSILPAGITDFGQGLSHLFYGDGTVLGAYVLKMISYVYSGTAPFLDPLVAFRVPCLGIDSDNEDNIKNWTENGKYDFGKFGRYGHPLSPLTLLALVTDQLESDKNLRENACVEILNDCEDV